MLTDMAASGNNKGRRGSGDSMRQPVKSGFGSSQRRFDYKSLHPAFSKHGIALQDETVHNHLAPGCYDVKSPLKEKLKKQWGTRGPYDVTTGPRFKSSDAKGELGPGYYTRDLLRINDVYEKKSFGRGICSYTGPRTAPLSNVEFPGVGSYKHTTFLDEMRARSVTPIGVCSQSPGERLQTQPNYGPVSYTLKSCVEETLERKTSNRGPYELTTGPRFKRADKTYAHLGPGVYDTDRFKVLDYDARKGKWGKNERFRTSKYIDQGVAPGSYEIRGCFTSQGFTPDKPKKVFISGANRFCPRFDRIASLENFVVSAGTYELKSPDIFDKDVAVSMKSHTPRFQKFGKL